MATQAEILRVAHLLAKVGHDLNVMGHAFSGEPCNNAFKAFRGTLAAAFGKARAEYIADRAIDDGQYDEASLAEYLEQCTPPGCLCDECVRSTMNGDITPVRHGNRGDRESWVRFAVFRNEDADPIVAECGDDPNEQAAGLTGWSESYRGPGYGFSHDPTIQRGKLHTMVTQSGGLDI